MNAIAPVWILSSRDIANGRGLGSPLDEELKPKIALRRQGTAEECAQVVAFLVSDQSSYITGQIVVVDGGVCLFPT